MKKILIIALFVLTINSAFCWGVTYYDDPITVGIGARPISMGKAFVAIADDPNAIFLNPAGLGTQKRWELATMSSNFLDEYQYVMFCGVNPTPLGVFGLGYVSSSIGDIAVGPGMTASFYNQAVVLSYGKNIEDILPDTYAGATFKYYSKGYTGAIDLSASGYNLDLGMLYVPEKWMSYGLNFQNVLPGAQIQGDFEPEEMHLITKIGASFYWMEQNVRFALDEDMYFGRANFPWPMHFGAEWKAQQNLYLRAGYDQVASAADGGNMTNNTTFGVGLDYSGIKVDLAYMQNYAQTNLASNVVSLSFYTEPMYAQEAPPSKEAPPKKVAAPPTPEAAAPPPVPTVKPVTVEAVPAAKTVDKKISFTPGGNLYTYDAQQVYSGNVDFDITDLWIGGKKVGLRSDRVFAVSVPLYIGKNGILVRLRDTSGAEAEIMTRVVRFYVPANMSLEEAKGKYFEYKVSYNQIHRFLGKDYSTMKTLSREILALIIAKAKKLDAGLLQENVSKDVSHMYWAARPIKAVKSAGIMKDFSDGTFKPDKLVTRAELARIMAKALGVSEAGTAEYLRGRPLSEQATMEDLVEIFYRSGLFGEEIDSYKNFIGFESSMI